MVVVEEIYREKERGMDNGRGWEKNYAKGTRGRIHNLTCLAKRE